MNPGKPLPPGNAKEEVPALIETLHQTDERLEELTAGEVDAVVDRRGRTSLLRRAQDHLRDREAAILNTLPASIAVLDTQGRIILVNEAWRQFSGANALQSPGDGIGVNYLEICDGARGDDAFDAQRAAAGIRSVLDGAAKNFSMEYPCHSPTAQRWFLMMVTPLAGDHPNGAVVMHLDVTAEKLSEERYHLLFDASIDAILLTTTDGHILAANPSACRMFGWTKEEILKGGRALLVDASDPRLPVALEERARTGSFMGELTFVRKGGAKFPGDISTSVFRDKDGHARTSMIIRDISERKAAEAKILRHTQLYVALSQSNQTIVHCTSEEELFLQICRIAVQFGGMKMAWVGLVDTATRMVLPVASFGDGTGYLRDLNISVDADGPLGGGPTGTAIRENQPFWCQDFMNDPLTVPWRERAASAGWAASASLPLHRNGMVVGAFTLYSGEADSFDKLARDLLVEMATDISFALDNFTRESQRKQAEEDIRFKNTMLLTQQETSPDAILVVDENLQIISYNQQFVDLWQLSAQLLSTRLDVRVLQSVVDQVENSEAFVARIKYLYAHRDDKSREEIPLKDGRIVDRYSAPITGADGKYYGRVWYFRDITGRKRAELELRESERRFSNLLGNVELVSVMLDPEARITYCNDYLLRLTGWRREEVIGKNWFELFVPPEISDLKDAFAALLANSPQALHHENEILTRSGERRLIRWNNSVLRSAAGDVTGTASIGEDITERKMAEEVLKQHAADLERFHRLSVGRELQMIELKKQINELAKQSGQKPPFELAFLSQEPVRTNPGHEQSS